MFFNTLTVSDLLDPQLASLGVNLPYCSFQSSAFHEEPAVDILMRLIISLDHIVPYFYRPQANYHRGHQMVTTGPGEPNCCGLALSGEV